MAKLEIVLVSRAKLFDVVEPDFRLNSGTEEACM